jgi:hypothetical protein
VTRVFATSRDLLVYLQAYDQTATTPAPIVAFVSFYRNGAKVFETRPVQFEEVLNAKLKTTPLKFSIPLEKLPAGKYDCQVSVVNAGAQKTAFWRSPILLVP